MNTNDLTSLLDLIYHGEVRIFQKDLNNFLSITYEFELKGMPKQIVEDNEAKNSYQPVEAGEIVDETNYSFVEETNFSFGEDESNKNTIVSSEVKPSVMVDFSDGDIDKQILSMVTNADNIWKCTMCEKQEKFKSFIKRHAHSHIKGYTYTCQ